MRDHGARRIGRRVEACTLAALVLVVGVARAAGAQQEPLAARVAAAPADGPVAMHFPARPGVCGDGRGHISLGRSTISSGGAVFSAGAVFDGRDWDRGPCEPGPVTVLLALRDHRVEDVGVTVGSRAPATATAVTDLGAVDPSEGAAYLLALARQEGGRVAERALLPAVLADRAVVWPALLAIVRDSATSGRRSARGSAAFWLSRFAAAARDGRPGDIAGRGETGDDEDDDGDVRGKAVFALAQLPRDEGIPSLIEVARGHRDPRVRDKALFWLGQSGDPRAYALFEELLTKTR